MKIKKIKMKKNIFARMDACESLLNRPVFVEDGDWWWKIGHLRQREVQTVVVEMRWGCPDGGQTWIDGQEGSSVCLVGLAGNQTTMSCSPIAKRSIRTCTTNKWTAWMQHSCRRGHLWSTEAELSSIRTTPGHTHLWWRPEAPGVRMGGSFACTV